MSGGSVGLFFNNWIPASRTGLCGRQHCPAAGSPSNSLPTPPTCSPMTTHCPAASAACAHSARAGTLPAIRVERKKRWCAPCGAWRGSGEGRAVGEGAGGATGRGATGEGAARPASICGPPPTHPIGARLAAGHQGVHHAPQQRPQRGARVVCAWQGSGGRGEVTRCSPEACWPCHAASGPARPIHRCHQAAPGRPCHASCQASTTAGHHTAHRCPQTRAPGPRAAAGTRRPRLHEAGRVVGRRVRRGVSAVDGRHPRDQATPAKAAALQGCACKACAQLSVRLK